MSDLHDEAGAGAGAILVSSQAELNAAIAAATGGETILLAGGAYQGLNLFGRTFETPVTIASADDEDPAVFTGTITLTGVNGFVISGVDVDGEVPLSGAGARISIRGGSDIALTDMNISGTIRPEIEGVEDELAGFPTEFGIRIDGAVGVSLDRLAMTDFAKAIRILNTQDISVTRSEIHQIRSDGIAMSSSTGILIEENHFHDFHPLIKPRGAGDHPDFIQYFGDRAGIGVHDVTIRNNAFIQGDGYAVQSIFGWSGGANPSPFTNFVISGNFIQNSQLHGITLGDVIGVEITDNVLIPRTYVHGETGAQRPLISLSNGAETDGMRDIYIADNILTLGWDPVFNPSKLDAAGNEERGVVYGDVTVLEQGRIVANYWSSIVLPDRQDFADHASWEEAAMAVLRADLPEAVAALLPPPVETVASGVVHVVGEGWTRLDSVDFAAGDTILIDETEAIASLDGLLARAAAAGAEAAEGVDLRLVEETANGLRVIDIDLAGIESEDGFAFLPAPRAVAAASGEAVSFAFAATEISGAAVARSGAAASVEGATLTYAAEATPGHQLDRVNFAVTDGDGAIGLGSVFVAVRGSEAVVQEGGDGRDNLFGGGGADALVGGDGADVLFARAGDDWLEGGAGNDRLTGGAGSDFLIGGAGADNFVFYGADFGDGAHDVILDLDFTEGDRLNFAHFEAGTFGAGYAFGPANGSGAAALNMAHFLALGAEAGFSLERIGEGHAMLTIGDGAGAIEVLFAGASVMAFEEAWPLA